MSASAPYPLHWRRLLHTPLHCHRYLQLLFGRRLSASHFGTTRQSRYGKKRRSKREAGVSETCEERRAILLGSEIFKTVMRRWYFVIRERIFSSLIPRDSHVSGDKCSMSVRAIALVNSSAISHDTHHSPELFLISKIFLCFNPTVYLSRQRLRSALVPRSASSSSLRAANLPRTAMFSIIKAVLTKFCLSQPCVVKVAIGVRRRHQLLRYSA